MEKFQATSGMAKSCRQGPWRRGMVHRPLAAGTGTAELKHTAAHWPASFSVSVRAGILIRLRRIHTTPTPTTGYIT